MYEWPWQERVLRAGEPSVQFWKGLPCAPLLGLGLEFASTEEPSDGKAGDMIRIYTLEITMAKLLKVTHLYPYRIGPMYVHACLPSSHSPATWGVQSLPLSVAPKFNVF